MGKAATKKRLRLVAYLGVRCLGEAPSSMWWALFVSGATRPWSYAVSPRDL